VLFAKLSRNLFGITLKTRERERETEREEKKESGYVLVCLETPE